MSYSCIYVLFIKKEEEIERYELKSKSQICKTVNNAFNFELINVMTLQNIFNTEEKNKKLEFFKRRYPNIRVYRFNSKEEIPKDLKPDFDSVTSFFESTIRLSSSKNFVYKVTIYLQDKSVTALIKRLPEAVIWLNKQVGMDIFTISMLNDKCRNQHKKGIMKNVDIHKVFIDDLSKDQLKQVIW